MFKETKKLEVFLIAAFLCSTLAQDFEPEPIEPPQQPDSTTDSSNAAITTEISTELPPELPTEPNTSLETTTAQETTLNPIETTTSWDETTFNPIDTTTSWDETTNKPNEATTETIETPSTTKRSTSTTTTQQSVPVTTSKPYHPSIPAQRCYFRKQQGILHQIWTCEGIKWRYNVECYHCCQSENFMFAGCNRVPYNYCEYNYNY